MLIKYVYNYYKFLYIIWSCVPLSCSETIQTFQEETLVRTVSGRISEAL